MLKYVFTTFIDLVGTKSSHSIKGRVDRPLWPWQDQCFTVKLWSKMLKHLINFGLVPRLNSNWEQGYCIATMWFCENWSLPCTSMVARRSSSSGDQPNQPLTFSFPKRIFGKKHPVYCFISGSRNISWLHCDQVNNKVFHFTYLKASKVGIHK